MLFTASGLIKIIYDTQDLSAEIHFIDYERSIRVNFI